MSEIERHCAPGSTALHPRSGGFWRITVQFVDDPASYSQTVTDCDGLNAVVAHLPLTVDATGYTLDDLARVTFTQL